MSTENEIVEQLKKLGVTCKSCWWQEGGRCYVEPCEREEIPGKAGSYSKKFATEVCEKHTSKRKVLGDLFPPGMLTIISEENDKAKGGDGINY